MIWSSTMSCTSSTDTVWPQVAQASSTLSAMRRTMKAGSLWSSSTTALALAMALTILVTSNVSSEPLRFRIFMGVHQPFTVIACVSNDSLCSGQEGPPHDVVFINIRLTICMVLANKQVNESRACGQKRRAVGRIGDCAGTLTAWRWVRRPRLARSPKSASGRLSPQPGRRLGSYLNTICSCTRHSGAQHERGYRH